ncbi:MAG: SusD/RagB family nutrient-binding outer membrane lipoprotein [Bacteroidota bacterium]|nr:SusD/RagB family nutrient-binding outer membrane lipoprotein [Bacteroidota bacterium]
MNKLRIKFRYRAIILFGLIGLLLGSTSCQDQLKDNFYNPDRQTKPDFAMLFTGVLQSTELFRMEYGPQYHQIRAFNRLLGLGTFPDGNNWDNAPDGSSMLWTTWSGVTLRETQFNKAYDFNKNVPILNLMINGLSAEEKPNYEIYVNCVNIVKAFIFQRLTDIYDDVPFSEANGAYQQKFFAKYDSQQYIYHTLLDELKTISTTLHGYQLNSSLAHSQFKNADILNNGDVTKWEKFANSLRLRMALRLEVVEPEVSKAVIADIVNNNLPLVSDDNDLIGLAEKDFAHVMEYYWPRAVSEMYYNCTAPRFMMRNLMGYNGPGTDEATVDPRMKVIFQPNSKGDYIGLDVWNPTQVAEANADMQAFNYDATWVSDALNWNYDDHLDTHYSMYNKMTYFNYNLKFPAFTPSETHLILAEAAIRYPELGINAAAEYRKAMQQSINWYYSMNSSNTFGPTSTPPVPNNIMPNSQPAKPSASVINTWLDSKVADFNALNAQDKYKAIFYQKYIHLNIFNHWELWSEHRRLAKELGTGFIYEHASKVFTWMERFYYPSGEATTNPDNFKAVSTQNDAVTPVWWTGRKNK